MPNTIFAEAVAAHQLPEFSCDTIQPEVPFGDSRLDFRLQGPDGVCWVETKSVTWVERGTAYFPDVPTQRGSRHLQELMKILSRSERAAVVFIIQREDAFQFSPAVSIDPHFAQTLKEVAEAGVDVLAYVCRVTMEEITLAHPVPLRFA